MRATVKGYSGFLIRMIADYTEIDDGTNIDRIVSSYEVAIWDGEKELSFPRVSATDIKFI